MAIARGMCEAIGETVEEFTGYSWRIGSATDLCVLLGLEPAKVVTKRRGRWHSDIYHIYERSDVGDQLRASAGLMGVTAVTHESLLPQWVQLGRRWAH